MAQIDNSELLARIQQAAVRVPMVGGVKKESLVDEEKSFQKLLDQKSQSSDRPETSPKAETPEKPQEKPQEAAGQNEEEDPVEMAKRAALVMQQIPLVQETVQPADQVLPQAGEGEVIALEGVAAAAQGENAPILTGEQGNAAQLEAAVYTQTAQPQQAEAAQGEALPQMQDQPQAQTQVQPEQAQQPDVPTVQEAQPQAEVKAEVQSDAGSQTQTSGEGEESDVQVTQGDSQPQPLFHDVKAAPIKVGDAPVLEEAPSVENQVNSQVLQALDQGQSKVTLQLTPDNLGKVTVEITRAEDGSLQVALSAENSQTRGLLEKHASNLQDLLASRQQETVQVHVQRQEESQRQQQHGYEDREGRNGQQQEQEQEQRRERHPQRDQDFMQQLRLGLIPVDGDID